MADYFKTIKDISEGLYKEKMSKFISFAIPVNNAEEAKEAVKQYQKNKILSSNKKLLHLFRLCGKIAL